MILPNNGTVPTMEPTQGTPIMDLILAQAATYLILVHDNDTERVLLFHEINHHVCVRERGKTQS